MAFGRFITSFSFLIFINHLAIPQQIDFCGADEYNLMIMKNETNKSFYQIREKKIYDITIERSYPEDNNDVLYTVPVVFHLICRPGSQPGDFYSGNPDDNTVIGSFLANINDAYRNTGNFNQGVGADMNIMFCLAQRDTNGNYTTGIIRFESDLSDSCGYMTNIYYTDSIKKMTSWNPEKYLNIWIVASLVDGSGFSTFPWSPRDYHDGVMININYLTTDYVAGVMLAHETGHYFGLYHVFQGGCPNDNCLIQGDKVCDTPPSTEDGVIITCSTNTCYTDVDDTSFSNPFVTDVNDNIRTYMNYGFPACINQFTEGQKVRARLYLENFRSQLLASDGCLTIGTESFQDAENELVIIINSDNGELRLKFMENGCYLVKLFDCRGICFFKSCSNYSLLDKLSVTNLKTGLYIIQVTEIRKGKNFTGKTILFF